MSITAIFYLLVYFTCLLKSLLGKPIYGLYAYFVAFYLHAPQMWWGQGLPDLRWSFLASIVALISILIHTDKENRKFLEIKETRLFALFVLYVSFQLSWALNVDVHKEYLILVIKFLILMYIIQNTIKEENNIIGFVLVNLLGCCYFVYLGMSQGVAGRMEGLGTAGMESANQLGQHIAAVLIFSSYLLFCDIGKKKYLLVPFILLVLNGVFLTASRGAIIGMLVAGFLALFLIPYSVKKKFFLYLSLALIAGSILVGPQIVERFESMVPDNTTGDQDNSAKSRFVIIAAQYEMFKTSPLLGHGHRGTLLLSNEYIPEEFMTVTEGGKTARSSHNLLMALLVDHGLIGTLLYLLIFFSCIKRAREINKLSHRYHESQLSSILIVGLALALVCFIIAGMGSNNKKLEMDIWLYAIIPVVYNIFKENNKSKKIS